MVAATILALMLVTGTRANLALLVGPIAMVFAHGRRSRRAIRLVGATFVCAIGLVALVFLTLQSGFVDATRLTGRVDALIRLGSDLTTDESYIERAAQANVAISVFTASPVAGIGLGSRFEWTSPLGQFYSTYNLDTGLALLAKFGVFGVGLLMMATGAVIGFYRRLRNRLPERLWLSFVGFAAIIIAVLPLTNPFEDKGFPLAAAILAAWALQVSRPTESEPGSPDRPQSPSGRGLGNSATAIGGGSRA
jgi:O-antigen ligase